MGFSMLRGSASHTDSHKPKDEGGNPLAPLILFAASPGTITGVITIAEGATHHNSHNVGESPLVGVKVVDRQR